MKVSRKVLLQKFINRLNSENVFISIPKKKTETYKGNENKDKMNNGGK